jgi:hypothetical protein
VTADRTPLAGTAAAADTLNEWLHVRFGWPEDRTGWTHCAEVDAGFLAAWESRIEGYVARTYGRSHPMTVSGFALDWYAAMAGLVGGACFRQARRVPRLDRAALAFRRHPDEEYPDGVALLDARFWCLPDDPEADHPDATVVADEEALAAVLRAQVRAHADDFFAAYAGRARLPRRHRLGAFFDGLDTGVWYGGNPQVGAAEEILRIGATVLPGATAEFDDASSIHLLTDRRGRTHLSRRRVGCCYYYKVADDQQACSTCPRVDDETRAVRYAETD